MIIWLMTGNEETQPLKSWPELLNEWLGEKTKDNKFELKAMDELFFTGLGEAMKNLGRKFKWELAVGDTTRQVELMNLPGSGNNFTVDDVVAGLLGVEQEINRVITDEGIVPEEAKRQMYEAAHQNKFRIAFMAGLAGGRVTDKVLTDMVNAWDSGVLILR